MTKLPDTLAKLRDNLAESGSQNGPYMPYDSNSFRNGFNCGAEAMRTYMQAEMDKLVEALEGLGEFTATHLDDMEHYFDNRCVPTVDEVNACAVADSEVRLAIASYRAWKDKNI